MLKFDISEQQIRFLKLQDDISQNYIDEVLFPAIKKGDWVKLESMLVLRNAQGKETKFSDDVWDLNIFGERKDSCRLYFTRTEERFDNAQKKAKRLERNICNQIKCYALCLLFLRKKYTARYLEINTKALIKLSLLMLDAGYNDFSKISTELFQEWAQHSTFFQTSRNLSAVNKLIEFSAELPFEINFDRLTTKLLNVKARESEQHLVIPPRIYTSILNSYTKEINELLPLLPDIDNAITELQSRERRFVEHELRRLRTGKATVDQVFPKNNKANYPKIVSEAFNEAGIELVDNLSCESWEATFRTLDVVFKNNPLNYIQRLEEPDIKIGDKVFKTVAQLKEYLRIVDCKGKAVCLALSGMRTDELDSIDPVFGAQTQTIKGQTIYLFTTRQSKITVNTQTKDDVFVTSKNGHNALRVLNAIHTPFRKQLQSEKHKFFTNLTQTLLPKVALKSSWRIGLSSVLNSAKKGGLDLKLDDTDMFYVQQANPEQNKLSVGSNFTVTSHQFRRSFAFYVIGFELMAFPQLKQQLSHFSSAMTMHYARNATSFQKLFTEIKEERTKQQADILTRVYQKLANKERIAGGKGKALKSIAGDGDNYFEKAENKRKLEPAYWQKLINDGKQHLHAIAPSMYCTNSSCSMRINIELAECVDCEHDIIENVWYVESVRFNAMKNILILDEAKELTHNMISQLSMKIKAAERIMDDLGYDYEPFQFPQSVLDAQIGVLNK